MSTAQTKFERVATTENGKIFKNTDLVKNLLGLESVEEGMLAIEASFPDEGDRTAYITIANLIYLDIKKQEYTSDYAYHIDELPDMVWDTFQKYQELKGTDRDYDGSIPFEAWIAKKVLRMGKYAYISGPTNYDHLLWSQQEKQSKQYFMNNNKGNLGSTEKSVEMLVGTDSPELSREFDIAAIIQRVDGLDKGILTKLDKLSLFEIGVLFKCYIGNSQITDYRYLQNHGYITTGKGRISQNLKDPEILELARKDAQTAKLIHSKDGIEYINDAAYSKRIKKVFSSFVTDEINELFERADEYFEYIFIKLVDYGFKSAIEYYMA